MKITSNELAKIVGRKVDAANSEALLLAIDAYPQIGFDRPHRLAQMLPQVIHESGGFRYVSEIWGPTKAQLGYEGRADLGNTETGDGSRFRGRGLIQVTGRANATAFRDWCWGEALPAPDFAAQPEKMAEAPWSGLTVTWFWHANGLNRLADLGDVENISRRINGGLNGYEDRLKWHWRTCLVLLGFEPTVDEIKKFQGSTGLKVDGVPGPNTRAALHGALVKLGAFPGAPLDNAAIGAALAELRAEVSILSARVGVLEARMGAVEAR